MQQLPASRVDLNDDTIGIGNEDTVQAGLEHSCSQAQLGRRAGFHRDVSIGVDTSYCHTATELRHGAALQNPAIEQLQYLRGFRSRQVLRILQKSELTLAADGLRFQVSKDGRIISLHEQWFG